MDLIAAQSLARRAANLADDSNIALSMAVQGEDLGEGEGVSRRVPPVNLSRQQALSSAARGRDAEGGGGRGGGGGGGGGDSIEEASKFILLGMQAAALLPD